MEKWIGKVAVVTGASSGIGEETCKQLVEKGLIVVGFARREDRLKVLKEKLNEKKGTFHYVKVDLCSEENILEAFNWVKNTLKSVDILVNNAGLFIPCDVIGDTNDMKQMFDTNVIAINICSREALKIMEETKIKDGHIINMNSVAGHFRIPLLKDFAIYSATKYGVTHLTESLRELVCLKDLPIRVTSISPGVVDTEMSTQFGSKTLEQMTALQPIDIANAILYALSTPHHVNVSEITLRPTIANPMKFFQSIF